VAERLWARFDPGRWRLDVRQAPLMRLMTAYDPARNRWIGVWLFHHLVTDHTTIDVLMTELRAHLLKRADQLPAPPPFRNFVAHAQRDGRQAEHAAFFRAMLGDVDEPTAPFGLLDVHGDGSAVREGRLSIGAELSARIRSAARGLKVSSASLVHVAWGRLLAQVSGRVDPVFGTVLFGRMEAGSDAHRVMGLFLNSLPVRLRLGGVAVKDAVLDTHVILGTLMQHEHASLAEVQRYSALPARTPLFSAILNYRYIDQSAVSTPEEVDAWSGVERLRGEERTNYPLILAVNDTGAEFGLAVQVSGDVDPERVCGMVRRALESLVEALETDPAKPVGRLDVLPPVERHRLLVEWNATAASWPREACLSELFEAQAGRTPEAVALVFGEETLSYGELNARANRLARHLRSLGVGPDDRVALCVERSLEMVVGLLAILKAGGAYVPLDPAYPGERLAFMVRDSGPVAALTHGGVRATLLAAMEAGASAVPVVDLDAPEAWSSEPSEDLQRSETGLGPHHLAYVIYTSGSTGTPKGVMVEHRNAVNLLSGLGKQLDVTPDLVLAAITPISFDISGLELWLPLVSGARVVIADRATAADGDALARLLARTRTSLLQATPATWRLLAQSGARLSGLRALCGGEALPSDVADFFTRAGLTAFNVYGPTETTIWSAVAPVPRKSGMPIPIGRPIANTRIYVLDGFMEPVPEGVAGEIWIGGAGVARGYLNRPELTAERFVASPFVVGDRLYRTGDLGRYLPDGSLEFLGRNDFQVKIRGFRIELGEIEARLLDHPEVREAVVLAREDQPGDKRLVAYYVGKAAAEAGSLREHLSRHLPEHMVPAAYVWLEALPLTPNGKLDRQALPAPDEASYASQAYEAPEGPIEETLASIWAEVLGLERVGRRDDFFDLGGHSLLAVRVVSRVRRRLGVEMSITALFKAPSLREAAAWLREHRSEDVERLERTAESLAQSVAGMSEAEILAKLAELEAE